MSRTSSREALVVAALGEFTEKGFEAATVQGIAERAGVTTGALYTHFRSKLHLLLAVLGVTPAASVFEHLAEVADGPWPLVSRRLGEELMGDPDAASVLLLDAVVAARRDPDVAATMRAGLAAYTDAMAAAAQAGAEAGLVEPAVWPGDLAQVLLLVSFGRLALAALGAPGPSDDAYLRLIDLLLKAPEPVVDEAPPVERVRSRAATLQRAQRDFEAAVADAVEGGHSLRQVGAAAGVSHERVRQMVRAR